MGHAASGTACAELKSYSRSVGGATRRGHSKVSYGLLNYVMRLAHSFGSGARFGIIGRPGENVAERALAKVAGRPAVCWLPGLRRRMGDECECRG